MVAPSREMSPNQLSPSKTPSRTTTLATMASRLRMISPLGEKPLHPILYVDPDPFSRDADLNQRLESALPRLNAGPDPAGLTPCRLPAVTGLDAPRAEAPALSPRERRVGRGSPPAARVPRCGMGRARE